MIVPVYIVLNDGADRPYVSSTPPSEERLKALHEQGCEVYRVDAVIPGWRREDFVIRLDAEIVKPEYGTKTNGESSPTDE